MKRTFGIGFLFLILFFVFLTPHPARGQFGSAVAVRDGSVFVMKPGGAFEGIAAIHVYRQSDGAWTLDQRISPEGAVETGQGLSPTLLWDAHRLFAAAGDADLRIGAHRLALSNESWLPDGQIDLREAAEPSPPASTDLNGIMRILQPPARTLALHGEILAIGVPGGGGTGVYLFRRSNEAWEPQAEIAEPPEGASSAFGASLALLDADLFVGAPAAAPAGAVHRYTRQPDDTWTPAGSLDPGDLPPAARFGTRIVFDGAAAFVGAPAGSDTAGTVLVFELDAAEDAWHNVQRLAAPDGAAGDGFGSAIARVKDELWIGAPSANGARGIVHRFERTASGEAWAHAGVLSPDELTPRARFGASLAGDEELAVVGAPGADGGNGLAAIFEIENNGAWMASTWVDAATALPAIAGEEISCEEGVASGFQCDNVDLLAYLPISELGAETREQVSDLWGWTDPLTGYEYALIGRTSGASIVDVTDPTRPAYLGLVPANPTPTRDLKVYREYLYFTGDGADDHGLVVFDMTRLRDVTNPPAMFQPDTVYHGVASAHNLIIDTQSGFAYAVGASRGGETCGGGLHMIDIREPLNPTFAGCFTDTIGLFSEGRTHDGQCTVYQGPDERYYDRQICFVSNETALRIVDVTDKTNPQPLSAARYPRTAYVHQGWLSEDQRYFYLDDELDELVGMTDRTRTLIWDVSELDDPVLVGQFEGSTPATDHNLFIKGDRMYQANYQAGLSVWDISNPEQPRQIGHFDTTPAAGNPPGFVGAWTAFPYFESGTVIVSSMHEGLFVVRPRDAETVP